MVDPSRPAEATEGGVLMWPDLGKALAYEQAVSDLYALALRRWAPTVESAALPALTAATLPPDPDAVTQQQAVDQWSTTTEAVILAGVAVLWSAAVIEAMNALDVPLPPLPTDRRDRTAVMGVRLSVMSDPAVVGKVEAATGLAEGELEDAFDRIEHSPTLSAARDDVVAAQREQAAFTPGAVATKMARAADAAQTLTMRAPEPPAADVVLAAQRDAVAEVLDPAGDEMRTLAHHAGYQAAAVQNAAVLTAAQQQNAYAETIGAAEELEKVWIGTLDGKTRPTHWAGDGQRVPLAGKFTIGGEHLDYPGDPTASAAERMNCRCRLGILAKDEPLPDEVDRHTERLDGRDSVAINRDGRTQAEEVERRTDAGNVRARDDEDGIGRVAAGGWAASSEQEQHMAGEQDTEIQTFLTWSGYIGKLGTSTSDRRILAADIDLTMREFPHPMAWQKQAVGGHYDSFTVGVVEEAKIDGDRVWASGYYLNSIEAMEAADQVGHKVSAPSLDLAAAEYIFTDEDGNEIEGDLYDWWEENGEPYAYFTNAEVTGFTLVQTPAFDGIDIVNGERETRDLAVVASVVTDLELKAYDPTLFEDPKLTRATAPTMNNSTGRIYGHLAEFGHPYRGGDGSELTPRNRNGYANFHTSQILLTNGKQLSVGRLTVRGGHASTKPGVTAATAQAHYDNVCTAFGLVRVGEDEFGIWFSGIPAPGVDPDTFQQGMTAPLSGDWRDSGRGLDMIGAHAVNSPGFPIYSAATGPNGREVALVASLGPARSKAAGQKTFGMSRDDLKTLLTEVVETLDRRTADRVAAAGRSAELAARRDAAFARAEEVAGPPPTPRDRVEALLTGRG